MTIIFISIITSFLSALFIISTLKYHSKITLDQDEGVQKFHTTKTPRIGGFAIFFGSMCGLLYAVSPDDSAFYFLFGISAIPVFFAGIWEDLTKVVQPKVRLLMAFISGVIFLTFLGGSLQSVGISWIDTYLLSNPLISLLFTSLIIAGVCNATNIIDGFNGLLLGFTVMATSVLIWVSYQVGDITILTLSIAFLGAIIGLMILNFPSGLIFTGDGGAYLIGFMLSTLSLMLITRNDSVSPWFAALLLLYPITETIYSIVRRVFVDRRSPFDADDRHLHTLLYFILKEGDSRRGSGGYLNDNARTSVVVWCIMLLTIIPSFLLWKDSQSLVVTSILFIASYSFIYYKVSTSNDAMTFDGQF